MTGGPLAGVRVVEVAALGPAPFAASLLADLGADVIRLDRADRVLASGVANPAAGFDPLGRGRRCAGVDLKHPDGVGLVLDLVAGADGLVEGFRPGVMERLGLGPDDCHGINERLVYGRMTGWGQTGSWAQRPGHDINYLGLTGALAVMGEPDRPPRPPLNLVADMGGGGMLLAFGMAAALVSAGRTGVGQVVDAAMIDGVAAQFGSIAGMIQMGLWNETRGANFLDGGAPYYRTYRCSDGRFVAVGAIEPQFYAALLERLGALDASLAADVAAGVMPDQDDQSAWPALSERFGAIFAARTRDQWVAHCDGHDCCVTPVLSVSEAIGHPHHATRQSFVEVAGVAQPAPAPRFDRTPLGVPIAAASPGQHTDEVLADWGIDGRRLATLRAAGVIA